MLEAMSWEQMVAWQEYHQLEPFGAERADLGFGIVASVMANVHRDPKRRPRPFSPSDFMPKFSETATKDTRRRPMTDPADFQKFKQLVIESATAKG
jgi:hypothetical protein